MGQGEQSDAEQVIWGQVTSNDGFRIMAFDILEPRSFDMGQNAFFISLRGSSATDLEARWAALAVDATILHPLGPAPWTSLYGMLRDRFSITWIVDLEPNVA